MITFLDACFNVHIFDGNNSLIICRYQFNLHGGSCFTGEIRDYSFLAGWVVNRLQKNTIEFKVMLRPRYSPVTPL